MKIKKQEEKVLDKIDERQMMEDIQLVRNDDSETTLNELYDMILINFIKNLNEHKLSFGEALHVLGVVKDDLIVCHLSGLYKRMDSIEKKLEENH